MTPQHARYITEFKEDILLSELVIQPSSDLEHLVQQYNRCFSELLDNHAPKNCITIKEKKQP